MIQKVTIDNKMVENRNDLLDEYYNQGKMLFIFFDVETCKDTTQGGSRVGRGLYSQRHHFFEDFLGFLQISSNNSPWKCKVPLTKMKRINAHSRFIHITKQCK